MRHTRLLLLAFLSVSCRPSGPAAAPADPSALLEMFRQRIEARKRSVIQGDSLAWLAAAHLDPRATCVDATGTKRSCRPDFAVPTQWTQRIALDSMSMEVMEHVAIITYRETDTIHVAGNTATGLARYVETYHLADSTWHLVALTEAAIPAPRAYRAAKIEDVGQFLGSYGTEAYTLHVTLKGGTLLIAAEGETPDTLWAISPAQFFVRGDIGTYQFPTTGKERPPALVYQRASQIYRFSRRDR